MLTIIGFVLLINPDIEIISVAGSIVMSVGLIPIGVKTLHLDYSLY
jgi:hypothetical protein